MSRDEIMDMQDRAEALGGVERHVRGANVLAYAGLLALTHEVMKYQVLDLVKRYFGEVDGEWTQDGGRSRYDRECRFLAPGKVFGSHVAWLIAQRALTEEQASALTDLQEHRGELVHDIASHLMSQNRKPDADTVGRPLEAFSALDLFWRKWATDEGLVEDIQPGAEFTVDEVKSGAGEAIDFAYRSYNVAFGNQGLLRRVLEEASFES